MRCNMFFDTFLTVETDPSPLKISISSHSKPLKVKGKADPSPTLHPLPLSQMKGVKGLFSRTSVKNNNKYEPFNPSPPLYPCKNPSTLHTSNSSHRCTFNYGHNCVKVKSQSVKGRVKTLHRPFTDPSLSPYTVTGLDSVYTEVQPS